MSFTVFAAVALAVSGINPACEVSLTHARTVSVASTSVTVNVTSATVFAATEAGDWVEQNVLIVAPVLAFSGLDSAAPVLLGWGTRPANPNFCELGLIEAPSFESTILSILSPSLSGYLAG
jgi:hypothetical protein